MNYKKQEKTENRKTGEKTRQGWSEIQSELAKNLPLEKKKSELLYVEQTDLELSEIPLPLLFEC